MKHKARQATWPYLLSKVNSAFAIILGSSAFIAWLFYFWVPHDYQILIATVKPNTAICFVLSGVALWLLSERKDNKLMKSLAEISSAAVFLIGFLTLFEYFFGINLGIDESI